MIATPSALHAEQSIAALERGAGRLLPEAARAAPPRRRRGWWTPRAPPTASWASTSPTASPSRCAASASSSPAGEIGRRLRGGPRLPQRLRARQALVLRSPPLGRRLRDGPRHPPGRPRPLDARLPEVEDGDVAGSSPAASRWALDPDRVEDYAVARLDLAGGATAQLACSWNLPAGREAVISATFYGTGGGVAMRNVDGSFYDFEAERFRGTSREALVRAPRRVGRPRRRRLGPPPRRRRALRPRGRAPGGGRRRARPDLRPMRRSPEPPAPVVGQPATDDGRRTTDASLRVLLSTDTVGGVWDYTLTLARELRARGHDVFLAVVGEPPEERLRPSRRGWRWMPATTGWSGCPARRPTWTPAGEWLAGLARSWGADVVHLNQMAYAVHDFGAPDAGRGAQRRALLVRRGEGRRGRPPEWGEYARLGAGGHRRGRRAGGASGYQSALTARHYGRGADRVIHNGVRARPPGRRRRAERPAGARAPGARGTRRRGWRCSTGRSGARRRRPRRAPPRRARRARDGQRFAGEHLVCHGRAEPRGGGRLDAARQRLRRAPRSTSRSASPRWRPRSTAARWC